MPTAIPKEPHGKKTSGKVEVEVEVGSKPDGDNKLKTRLGREPRAMRVMAKDVDKYSPTTGCQACTEIMMNRTGEKNKSLHITPHTGGCRARMKGLRCNDPDDQRRVTNVEGRQRRHREEKESAKNGESTVGTSVATPNDASEIRPENN